MKPSVKDVETYLAELPEPERATLQHLREVIKSAAPEAQEVISYQMPAFKDHGMLVYYAAFKDHCSLFVTENIYGQFMEELKGFKLAKGTIQFTTDHPIPDALVKKIVKAKLKINRRKIK